VRHKTCTHCGTILPITSFPPNRRTSDGVSSWCRACSNQATRLIGHDRETHISPLNDKRPALAGLFLELRGRDSNPNFLIQSQASYH
jgi:hypothetical protein